jgi:glycosyltransferase involved in cell wall biosynthesis
VKVVALFNTVDAGNIGLENFALQESGLRRTIVVTKQSREDALMQIDKAYPDCKVQIVSSREASKSSLFGGVLNFMRIERPMVMHAHHAQAALLGALLRCIPRTRLLTTAHNNFDRYKIRHKISFGFAFLFADRIVCNSEGTKASLPWFVRRKKSSVIHNGVDFRKLDIASSSIEKTQTETVIVGTVCRMVPQKDLPTLLRGFAKAYAQSEVPLKLRLVGDGPERRNIDRLICELDIEDAVELTGALPRHKVYETLVDIDIFVVSSRWEGFCNAMVEAGASAKAILATDIDPLPEVIGRENAVFFNAGDSEALGKQLLGLSVDSRHRGKLGQKARDFVRNRYSLELSAERYRKVYEGLAEDLQGERG